MHNDRLQLHKLLLSDVIVHVHECKLNHAKVIWSLRNCSSPSIMCLLTYSLERYFCFWEGCPQEGTVQFRCYKPKQLVYACLAFWRTDTACLGLKNFAGLSLKLTENITIPERLQFSTKWLSLMMLYSSISPEGDSGVHVSFPLTNSMFFMRRKMQL